MVNTVEAKYFSMMMNCAPDVCSDEQLKIPNDSHRAYIWNKKIYFYRT